MTRMQGRRGALRSALTIAIAGVAVASWPPVLLYENWTVVYDAGIGAGYTNGVAIDSTGCVINADLLTATPGTDGQLVRRFSNGTTDWAKVLDNPASDAAPSVSGDSYTSVCVDTGDNVIAGGSWSGDYFGGDLFHNTAIVRKYSPAGVMAWEWRGDSAYEAWSAVRSVATDAAGNVYGAGNAFLSWGVNQHDWAIWKWGPDGVLASGYPLFYNYSQNYAVSDIAFGIAVHTDGSFVVAGVRGEADNADTAKRNLDWHVRKYDAGGSLVWEDTFAGAALLHDYARAVTIDANGDVYVAGHTNVGTDNTGGLDWDGLVVKYAKDTGQRIWTQRVGDETGRHGVCYAVTMGPGGRVLVARTDGAIGGTLTETVLDLRDPSDGSIVASETMYAGGTNIPYAVAYRDGVIVVGGYRTGPSKNDALTASFDAAPPASQAPILDAPPAASTSLAATGETVNFHATAHDPDGDPITYAWDFGDGAAASGADASHVYAAAGARHVVVTVSDGGVPVTGFVDIVVGEPLVTPAVAASVDFRKPGRDTFALTSRLELPLGFAPEGRELTVDAGGVQRTFTLDRKGKAKTADGTVSLTYEKKKQLWKLSVKFAKGEYAPEWADERLTSRTTRKEAVTIKTTVDISGEFRCAHLVQELYTAKEGKTGSLK